MRLNKYVALATGMSRRAADKAIDWGRVTINGTPANAGQQVAPTDAIELDGEALNAPDQTQTIILNKPVGYICSRDGQGGKTIYDLLPPELHHLKPVGRLDKDSSGLLLLTNDGDLAHKLTHPSFQKIKKYNVALNKDLSELDFERVTKRGVKLDDGPSSFDLESVNDQLKEWKVTMTEGRNRQIRRTFQALGYSVTKLHRKQFGDYTLGMLPTGEFRTVTKT